MTRNISEVHNSLPYFREALRIYRLRSSWEDGDESLWSAGYGDEKDVFVSKILEFF